jgi:hypothetical protein
VHQLKVACTSFRPWPKNTLCGFASIRTAEIGLTIYDVAVHQKGSTRWARPPARPQVRDGVLVRDGEGKILYAKILEFDDRSAFSAAMIKAVLEHAPNAFEIGEVTHNDEIQVTKCPPGEAFGAHDLERWAQSRTADQSGVWSSRKERQAAAKFERRPKRDAADRWLARNRKDTSK